MNYSVAYPHTQRRGKTSFCTIVQSPSVRQRDNVPKELPLSHTAGILCSKTIRHRGISGMPLDTSARIGLGGTALFTLAGLGVPLFGWEILGPIMAVCALVAMWGFWPLLRDRLPVIFKYLRGAGMRHAMLAGMLILGLGIGDLIGTNNFVFWDKYPGTGPIVWNFEDAARGRGYFLDLQKQPDRGVVVAGFGAHGKNITSEPVMDFDGYL